MAHPGRRWPRWLRWLKPLGLPLVIIGALVGLLALFIVAEGPVRIVFALLFGWLSFGWAAVESARLNWVTVAEAGICITIFFAGSHWMASWLYRASASGEPRVWRLRWTGAGLAIVMLLFVIGISLIGIIHQTVWLVSTDKTWFRSTFDAVYAMQEAYNLTQSSKSDIESFYFEHNRWPSTTEEVFGKPVVPLDGHYIRSMTVHAKGRMVLQLDDRVIDGEIFEMQPEVIQSGVHWRCRQNIRPQRRPCQDELD
jgi:hypothetical protein